MFTEKEIPIGPAEWQMWLAMPTTQVVMDALAAERSIIVQRLAMGETLVDGREVKETARAVGIVEGLTIMLEDMELTLLQQWEAAQQKKEEEREEEESGE